MKRLILLCLILLTPHTQAEEFTLLNGGSLAFAPEHPGQPTVLIFWASWCGYCMKEIPHLKEAQARYPGLRWLGVNVNKVAEDGSRTVTERGITWPSIADPDLTLTDRFGIRGTPGLIVLASDGETLFRGRRTNTAFHQALQDASQ